VTFGVSFVVPPAFRPEAPDQGSVFALRATPDESGIINHKSEIRNQKSYIIYHISYITGIPQAFVKKE
jgi:hypothetical protein